MRKPTPHFRAVQKSRNVTELHFDNVRAGWEQFVLLSSDRHHDSALCDHELELEHLKEAQLCEAVIIDCGDLFDAMQSNDDKRQNKSELREEDKGRNYLDRLVGNAASFYAPYAENIALLGRGNHEVAILSRYGRDLTAALASELNLHHNGHVASGWFGGWVIMRFHIQSTVVFTLRLKYFHGSGVGAVVTRGTLQTGRQQLYLPDADVIVNGHSHDSWYMPIARERVSNTGVVSQDLCHHIRLAGYKDEYRDGAEGWTVERGGAPKPVGAAWLRLQYSGKRATKAKIGVDVMAALR